MTVHEFAADYWDNWIGPLKAKALHAGPAERKRLEQEIKRLLKDREEQIIKTFGAMP